MEQALKLESERIAQEVYALILSIEPGAWKAEVEAAVRERLDALAVRLREWMERCDAPGAGAAAALRDRMATLARVVEEHRPRPGLPAEQVRAEWNAFRRRMQPAYNRVAAALRAEQIHLPELRPSNHRRKLFHMAMGTTGLLCMHHLLDRAGIIAVMAVLTGIAGTLEILRRGGNRLNDWLMEQLGSIAHPHEWHRVNSGTWYCAGLLILALTAPFMAAAVGVAVLTFGDPAAALVGRRLGRVRFANGRSLEGTMAFFVVAVVASLVVMGVYYPAVSSRAALPIAIAAALAGAVAELFSGRIDDNLAVPLAAAGGAAAVAAMITV